MSDRPSDSEPAETPELALARRAATGDRDALAELFQLYVGPAYGTALRILRSPQDAEDVVQEVFMALPHTLRTFKGTGSLEGWLRRVASRVALMHVRKQKRRREVPVESGLLEYLMPDPSDTDERRVYKIGLHIAVQNLPDKYRLVVVLKEIEGFSHVEVANLLGITARASRVRLHRARKLLKKRL